MAATTPPADMAMQPADMASAPAEDLAPPPDLAPRPPDLAGPDFCRGTAVAGTCVQTVLASAADCFAVNGACTQTPVQDGYDFCWASGAHLKGVSDPMTNITHLTWFKNALTCLEGDQQSRKGQPPIYTLTVAGKTVVIDENVGSVTCPDKTQVVIGANDGNCAALSALLHPDSKGCMDGMCP